MFELFVASFVRNLKPAILHQEANHFAAAHRTPSPA